MVRTEYRHVHEHSSTNLTLVADFRRSPGASNRGDKGQFRRKIAIKLSNKAISDERTNRWHIPQAVTSMISPGAADEQPDRRKRRPGRRKNGRE
jgi:hypothetical protein